MIRDLRKTKKKKLGVDEISACHPRLKRRGGAPSTRCLPSSVYRSVVRGRTRVAGGVGNAAGNASGNAAKADPFRAVGCRPGEEHCLLDKAPLPDEQKKQLRKTYLRPRMPKSWEKDPDMWLDNFNIAHVMKQYEEAVPSFRFLGVFPIDFSMPDPYTTTGKEQCLYKETCNIQLQREYDRGVRGMGIIFNLDPHNKGGSHWVGLYINLQNIRVPQIGYFDSYGYKTPPMIARLMRSFKLQNKNCELAYNARRFQFGHSECGMFSMYFIVCMIAGITFKDFCSTSVNDEFMLQLRHIFFAH